jgi:hypothetical protein
MLLGVAFKLDLDSYRNEAFAAFLATPTKDVTAGFRGHAGAKTELVLASALGWLEGAFAHGWCLR